MSPEDEKVITDILSKPFIVFVTASTTFAFTSLLWAYLGGC